MYGAKIPMAHGETMALRPTTLVRDVRQAEPVGIEAGGGSRVDEEVATLTFLIRAPNFDTSDVTAALELTPDLVWKLGDQVVTPIGTIVSGSFRTDAAWSYTWYVATKSDFNSEWQELLACLERGSATIKRIRSMSPSSMVLICRSSHVTRCGATIPSTELGRLAMLGVDFSFEIFAD
jgi:Domain of unknown function (DUF4279)